MERNRVKLTALFRGQCFPHSIFDPLHAVCVPVGAHVFCNEPDVPGVCYIELHRTLTPDYL
ncbi:hypothetical protein J6590_059516 [Homalodisca vitripennis]|nr:hypothetical protein J6590_059516 [Homalodisca vitripennis]